ncbi:hypothetical protein BFL40_12030 [Pseudomonas costantinii]|uniref:Uncharacterized protein n=1 Tax=Pseudomonas costantinii TaxID=168469 RepID=A0A1S2V362_9PSED|nr:hypothetical protein BFL40_12030 [Pseudomonas costantinii]
MKRFIQGEHRGQGTLLPDTALLDKGVDMVAHFSRPVLVVSGEGGAGVTLKRMRVVMQIVLGENMYRISSRAWPTWWLPWSFAAGWSAPAEMPLAWSLPYSIPAWLVHCLRSTNNRAATGPLRNWQSAAIPHARSSRTASK